MVTALGLLLFGGIYVRFGDSRCRVSFSFPTVPLSIININYAV